MTEREEWRPIIGYEGIYEVSSFGRVRSLEREDNTGRKRDSVILRPGQDKKRGYLNVGLCVKGTTKHRHVHSLVAEAFLGQRPDGMEVGHIDHDPSNNHYANLEYVTHAKNMECSARVGRMGGLSVEDVQDVREIFAENPRTSLREIADVLNVTPQMIANIARAKTYVRVPNRDGSLPRPISIKPQLTVDDIVSLQAQGMTLPEIGRFYKVEYSTPYQILRRARLHASASDAIFLK